MVKRAGRYGAIWGWNGCIAFSPSPEEFPGKKCCLSLLGRLQKHTSSSLALSNALTNSLLQPRYGQTHAYSSCSWSPAQFHEDRALGPGSGCPAGTDLLHRTYLNAVAPGLIFWLEAEETSHADAPSF